MELQNGPCHSRRITAAFTRCKDLVILFSITLSCSVLLCVTLQSSVLVMVAQTLMDHATPLGSSRVFLGSHILSEFHEDKPSSIWLGVTKHHLEEYLISHIQSADTLSSLFPWDLRGLWFWRMRILFKNGNPHHSKEHYTKLLTCCQEGSIINQRVREKYTKEEMLIDNRTTDRMGYDIAKTAAWTGHGRERCNAAERGQERHQGQTVSQTIL